MKRVLLNILIAVFSVALMIFVVDFFHGSLEAYPPEEQIEKIKTVSLLFISLNLIADVIVIRLRTKI